MSKPLITEDLFNNISYDMDNLKVGTTTTTTEASTTSSPTVLLIFGNSDINAAIHHLLKSLQNPLNNKAAIATVLVQESIKKDFEQKIESLLKPAGEGFPKSAQFVNALETIKKLSAQVISVADGPTLVYDFTHEQFGGQFTGVVTVHTFRTAKEAITLVGKEALTFSNVSIWHENHAYAYEIVAALKCNNFFINCNNMPLTVLDESVAQGKSFVVMDKNYHYETMQHNGIQKCIVFPVGSIFAN